MEKESVINWLKRELYPKMEFINYEDRVAMNNIFKKAKEMEYNQMKIEIPTDEEIERIADKYLIKGKEVFIHGAKWMRDKIKGGNK